MNEQQKEFDFFKYKTPKKKNWFAKNIMLLPIFIVAMSDLCIGLGAYIINDPVVYNQIAQIDTSYINKTNTALNDTTEVYFPGTNKNYKSVPLVDSFEGFTSQKNYRHDYSQPLTDEDIGIANH